MGIVQRTVYPQILFRYNWLLIKSALPFMGEKWEGKGFANGIFFQQQDFRSYQPVE